MNVKPLLLTSLIVAAILAAFGIWAAGQLPPGTELPTHWNAAGEVDDWMPALQALLVAPGILLVTAVIFSLVPRLEPLQKKLAGSAPVLRASWIGLILLSGFLQLLIAAPVLGIEAEGHWVLVAVGLLFVLIGNAMPKSRPGFFVGIRTPWTITDTDNWVATHRLGGKLFMMAGAASIALGILDVTPGTRMIGMIAAMILAVVVPYIFSWWLWKAGRSDASRG